MLFFQLQVIFLSRTLFIFSLTYSGRSGQTKWLSLENDKIIFKHDAVSCKKGDSIVIEDLTELNKSSCTNRTSFTSKHIKAAVRRDCSGKLKCEERNILKLLKKYKCDDDSIRISSITLIYRCEPFDKKMNSNLVLDMCSQFEKTISNNNITSSLVLKSKTNVSQRCFLNSNDANKKITLKTLQVDFGSLCDTTDKCTGLVQIYVDSRLRSDLKNNGEKPMPFSGANFELIIFMPTGLIWLEIITNINDTINCTKIADCSEGENEDNDVNGENGGYEDDENDDSDNVTVIVSSVIAVIAVIALTCVCAVLVCRVNSKRLKGSVPQNEILVKQSDNYNYVTIEKDTKHHYAVNSESRSTPENGIYHSTKPLLSVEKREQVIHDESVKEIYSQVNKDKSSDAVCAARTADGDTRETGIPTSDVDEYSQLAHFKVETRTTENIYDG